MLFIADNLSIRMAQKREYNVIFRESRTIVATIDEACAELGTCRSVFCREAVRAKLQEVTKK